MNPNMVIVKIDDVLHAFPMCGNGKIMNPSIPFTSEYEMEDHHIVIASYDTKKNESFELCRFINIDKGVPTPVKELMRGNGLVEFTKKVMSDFHKNGGSFDEMEVIE